MRVRSPGSLFSSSRATYHMFRLVLDPGRHTHRDPRQYERSRLHRQPFVSFRKLVPSFLRKISPFALTPMQLDSGHAVRRQTTFNAKSSWNIHW